MTDLKAKLEVSMQQRSPNAAIRKVVADCISAGSDRQTLTEELENLRAEVNSNAEVLDFLAGWCQPDMII